VHNFHVDCTHDCTKEKQTAVIHSLSESVTGLKITGIYLLRKGKIRYPSEVCMNGLKFSRMSEEVSLIQSAQDDCPYHPNGYWEKVNFHLCYYGAHMYPYTCDEDTPNSITNY
jgi:hypothetical protein